TGETSSGRGGGWRWPPRVDEQIEHATEALGPLAQVPVAPASSPLISHLGDEVARAYTGVVAAAFPPPAAASGLRVVYTPLHGVAAGLLLRTLGQAGYPAPQVVAPPAAPALDVPPVAFPTPAPPGARDLALARARELGAALVIATAPDGDRLAVAVPGPGGPGAAVAVPGPGGAGGWRMLTGDQVGSLLGAYLLEGGGADGGQPLTRADGGQPLARADGAGSPEPLVATTVGSSTMLSKSAAAAGGPCAA